MALVLQVLVTGLAIGALYGIIALGLSLIYRLTGVVHFALGELVALTLFVTLFVAGGTGPVTATNVSLGRFVLAIGCGLAVAVAAGIALHRFAVRPFLRREGDLGWIAAMVGAALVVHGLLASLFPREAYVFPDPFRFDRLPNGGVLDLGGGVTVPVRAFLVLAAGALLAFAASRFLATAHAGQGLRAIAADRQAARLVGLPVDRLLAVAFAGAGALAGLIAVVAAPGAPITVDTGSLLGLKGLVAALLARFGGPWRAFLAGLALGVLEASVAGLGVGGPWLGPAWRDVIPLALALVVMAVRRAPPAREELA